MKHEIPLHLQGEDWARLPKVGRLGEAGGRLCGLSRTTLLELSEARLIRTVAIRKPGAIKGIRLVYLPSLYAYLEGLATQEAAVEDADSFDAYPERLAAEQAARQEVID